MDNILKDRRLHLLLASNIISSIGSGITIIAVPWYLIQRENGDQIFGYTTLAVTFAMFLLSPYIGVLIDRFSRKGFLLFTQVLGLLFVFPNALLGLYTGQLDTWQLILIYTGGSLYYGTHLNALIALNHEIFDRSQYGTLNSTMEIQSQISSMASGGLASLLLESIPLSSILLVDSFTYLISFVLLSLIPYQTNPYKKQRKVTILSDITDGFQYIKSSPKLILLFGCSLMPFVCVMIGNYLNPIYILETLQADTMIMGLSGTVYALGAVFVGLTIPFLMKKWGAYRILLLTIAIYALGMVLIAMIPVVSLFLVLRVSSGWGNAGSRIARNTLMMELIPNDLMGRANSFFNSIGFGLRVILLILFTKTVTTTGAAIPFAILGLLCVLSFIGILMSEKISRIEKEAHRRSY